MIYFFTWNSDYLVREKTNSWKKAYIEKYGDFNLTHFKDIKNTPGNTLHQEILSWGFMWEKKLIIIDNFPLKTSDKSSQSNEKQDFLESILENIPNDNIVIFSSYSPDKRSKFYKKLKKTATKVEEFNVSQDSDLFQIINSKYWDKITSSAISLLIRYKSGNLDKIISEINKLLILNNKINDETVRENIFPELEESIFQLIDDISDIKIFEAINKLNIILSQVSVYGFYNNLISNLRVIVFIKNLKKPQPKHLLKGERIEQKNISEVLDLGNRSFLVNKNYKISLDSLNSLYIWLINLDKKMKSWKMIWSEEEVLKYEIEKEILKIKK
jgi:DNA polymerase III delta subunit